MRILVLGGTGDMGRRAALELSRSPDVEKVTVAGRTLAKAEAVAASLGPRGQAAAVDVRDEAALVTAMRGHDVVAGAMGPFYLFEKPVARAAVAARVPYVSICDDHDAVEALFALDGEAQAAGVTVLTGVGWTPGLTNVMARRAASQLDEAREVHVAWIGSGAASGGEAVILHVLHIVTGSVPTFRGGRREMVPAGTGRKDVAFPPPIGRRPVWHVGHPEPVTLPRYMPRLREVTLRGGLVEPMLNRLAFGVARLGLTRHEGTRRRLARLFSRMGPLFQKVFRQVYPAAAHVEVAGIKEGRPARLVLTAVAPMADLTGIPLAVAALMMGRGQIPRTGVIAPEAEGAIPPDEFLAEVQERGISVEQRLEFDR